MGALKDFFGRFAPTKVNDEQYNLPEGFVEKFEEFGRILTATGREMPEIWTARSPYICAFEYSHNSGMKKWIIVNDTSFHIRYRDKTLGTNSGLAVLDLDKQAQCYRLQQAHEYDVPEEALADFVKIISSYADKNFMRVLNEKLDESLVLDLNAAASVDAPENIEEVEAPVTTAPEPVAPIK